MKTLADLTAPAAIQAKPLLETEIQERCVAWARARGYWARKFSSVSQRSVPDYLFARDQTLQHRAMKFATEFKRETAKRDPETGLMSTDAQIEEQNRMRAAGWYVFECNDVEQFKKAVIAFEELHRIFG